MIDIEKMINGEIARLRLTSVASSGALNFYGPDEGIGHGWWYHRYLKWLFANFEYSELSSWVSKTTPLNRRDGNMKINDKTLQPVSLFPNCVVIKPHEGVMLNAVGLSSPGLLNLLLRGEWQKITSPFGISLAAISSNPKERLEELQTMVCILRAFLPYFHTFFFIEYNPSCPNVGHNPCDLEKWILPELEVLSSLGVILSVKLSPTVSFETVRDIEQSGLCSWISFANTIPFGKFPDKVDWKRFFGTANPELSPLRRRGYGAGGFSGWPSIDIVPPLIQYFHDKGITTPFLGGSGIGYRRLKHLYGEIKAYHDADTDALQFGGMFPMRPWLVKPAIRITNEMFGKGR